MLSSFPRLCIFPRNMRSIAVTAENESLECIVDFREKLRTIFLSEERILAQSIWS